MRGSVVALAALSTAAAAAILVPSSRSATVGTVDTVPAVLSPALLSPLALRPVGLPYPCVMFRDSQALALRTQCATAQLLRHRARALERDPLR